jgi:DNA end-binding protein Ku
MEARNVVGVSRVVLGRRERPIVLEARGSGIVVWTLRFGDEVRPEKDYFTGIGENPNAKSVAALETLIKKRTKDWSLNMVSDPIQESLLKLIADKKKARKPVRTTTSKTKKKDKETPSNVVNIVDALKKSVQKELKSRRAG